LTPRFPVCMDGIALDGRDRAHVGIQVLIFLLLLLLLLLRFTAERAVVFFVGIRIFRARLEREHGRDRRLFGRQQAILDLGRLFLLDGCLHGHVHGSWWFQRWSIGVHGSIRRRAGNGARDCARLLRGQLHERIGTTATTHGAVGRGRRQQRRQHSRGGGRRRRRRRRMMVMLLVLIVVRRWRSLWSIMRRVPLSVLWMHRW